MSAATKRTKTVVAVLVALGTFAASLVAQSAPDRTRPPMVGPPPRLNLPDIQRRMLSNGLAVWLVESHEVPLVQVNLLVKAGAGDDPAGKFGLASLTAAMLDEGAGSRNALELADAVDFLGASLATTASFDASAVRLNVPVARIKEALPLMADVILRPTFPGAELERLRQERLTALLQAKDDPASVAPMAFARTVFGATHRYGTGVAGTETTLKAFTVPDLKTFHASKYQPGNSVLIVVGDVKLDAIVPQLEMQFGSWKGTSPTRVPVPQAPQVAQGQITIVDMPGAEQSQIRMGWVGVSRSTPDYFTLEVLNTILGGSFTSRLNQNLREAHGFAYGASSVFDMRRSAGPFYAAAGVQTDKTAAALTEFFKELEGIRKPIPSEEVERAKNYVALLMPRSFETTGSMAGSLATAFVYNLPPDYFATFTQRVRAVTPAEVNAAAQRYIQPDKFAVVVVGDRKVIEPGIKALNLGPIRIVETSEVMK